MIIKFNDFNEQNEGLKSVITNTALVTVLACTTPSCDFKNKPNIEHINVVNLNNITNFTIEEKVISINTQFEVSSNDTNICKIEEKLISLTPTFEMYDMSDKLIAYSKVDIFSLTTTIEIFDDKDNYIGKIQHEIFENLLSIENTYSIYNEKNNRIGTSKKLEILSTDITIFDNNNNKILSIERDVINLVSDTWKIISKSNIDKRLILFIPCYKTYYDNKKEEEKNKDKE